MKPPRFHPAALLAVILLIAGVVAWLMSRETVQRTTTPPEALMERRVAAAMPLAPASAAAPEPATAVAPPGPLDEGPREMQAYRLAVRKGVVSLEGTDRIKGDFRQRRGPVPWMPGLWCVRLLDANLKVLAEETAAAPDDTCVVLDPDNKDATGAPQATQFAGAGEEAMLQVRLPPQPDAKWLKVYRLGGMQRADWNTEPLGQLLVSIPLP